jgi:hypothetical protein
MRSSLTEQTTEYGNPPTMRLRTLPSTIGNARRLVQHVPWLCHVQVAADLAPKEVDSC